MAEERKEIEIEQYLLNELSEPAREEIEERLFADDDFFLEVQSAEMGLIDRYIQNTLSAEELAKIDKKYLVTPERKQRVAESRIFHAELEMLRQKAQDVAEYKSSWFKRLFVGWNFSIPAIQYAPAGLILFLTLTAAWLVYDGIQVRQDLMLAKNKQAESEAALSGQLARAEQELKDQLAERTSDDSEALSALENEVEELRAQLEKTKLKAADGNSANYSQQTSLTATIILPTMRGGGDVPVSISIGKATQVLNVRIPVGESERDSLDVTVTHGTEMILSRKINPRETKAGRIVSLNLAAGRLSGGRYDVLLKNEKGEELKRAFTLERK